MPFDDTSLVMKVMDKMFILISLDPNNRIAVKCDPDYALTLREQYEGIEPAYHFNKKYWNQVYLDRDVNDELVCRLIDHSVEEILKKMTRKQRAAYEAL